MKWSDLTDVIGKIAPIVGTANLNGRAMKLNIVADEVDTTITTNPIVNTYKEP